MIREWEKFHAEFKKLKSTADRYTDKVAGSYLKQITQSKAACDKAEAEVIQAVDEARAGGVTGKTLDDFLKFKDFAAAKKKMDTALAELDDDIKSLSTYCREAQKVSDQIVTLHKALEKDLKARKSVSDGRKETEALRQKSEEAATQLAATTELLRVRQNEITEAETRLRATMAAQEAAKAELTRLLPAAADPTKPAAQ